jgi:hypothetical protein
LPWPGIINRREDILRLCWNGEQIQGHQRQKPLTAKLFQKFHNSIQFSPAAGWNIPTINV